MSSVAPKSALLQCPKCSAALVVEGAHATDRVLCGQCSVAFLMSGEEVVSPSSALAITSLVLGASSLALAICTGPLAIVAGAVALIAIRRNPTRHQGVRWAWSGIGLGGAGTFLCTGLLIAASVSFLSSFVGPAVDNTNVVVIESMRATTIRTEIPAGYRPLLLRTAAMRQFAFYGDGEGVGASTTEIVVGRFDRAVSSTAPATFQWMVGSHPFNGDEQRVRWRMRDRSWLVRRDEGEDSNGPFVRYIAVRTGERFGVGVMVVTRPETGMAEDEVRQFFESLELAPYAADKPK
ncbi:MAG: DUF4190 domain-containing protein [Pirellulaceae bacterium]|jgi:hypothetical protein|nr:DUF4190 domain-containing protein [Pirellulaceae bacterium]